MNRIIPPGMFQDPNWREVHEARLRGTPPGQRNVPPEIAPGSLPPEIRPLRGQPPNSRGASIVISAGETRKTILQVRSKGEDAETMCITVGAAPVNHSFKPALFPPFSADAFAPINSAVLVGRLTWGVGQASYSAFFDLNRGQIISVPATFLELSIDYTDFGVGGQPPFQVSASVAYGEQPQQRSAPARFTQFLGVLAATGMPGDTISAPIPPWAIAFTPMTSTPADVAPSLSMEVIDSGLAFAGMIYTYTSHENVAWNQENQFPIWNGAELVRVANLEAFSRAVNLVYTLSI